MRYPLHPVIRLASADSKPESQCAVVVSFDADERSFRVLRLARELRDAFDRAPPLAIHIEDFDVIFDDFPHGCCLDSSILAAEVFRSCGHHVQIISAWRGERTHAWMLVDGLIVDLTADQFNERMPAVFVALTSVWHDAWDIDERIDSTVSEYEEPWRTWFGQGVAALRERLQT